MSQRNQSFKRCIACNRPLPNHTKVCPYCDETLSLSLWSNPDRLLPIILTATLIASAIIFHYCLDNIHAFVSVLKDLFASKVFCFIYSILVILIFSPVKFLHLPGKPTQKSFILLLKAILIRIQLLIILTLFITITATLMQ